MSESVCFDCVGCVCTVLQAALRATVHWTEDGLATALAPGLVAVGPTSEHAATLCLRMAASIVLAMQSAHAIRKPVQVRHVGVNEL